jgi:DNA polymerase-3 subunit gamma/tau
MYQALYRKWRPKTFAEVVGQESVTVTLANEVRDGRISHAYLFTGTRGTGKTTCAKIFAKAVNCLNPKNGNPCNACAMCTGIDSGSVMDVVELDAASNNGVDDIRSLIDETGFTPAQASYRVYIIDEVHMLSASASNAFLKTLEEPPEHVIFILATTDAHKLLPTIRSRCQRFDFKRIYAEDIVDRLLFVAGEESIDLDRDAAVLLARLADGALRDALSMLDLCATGETRVTVEVVRRVTGLADKHYLFDLADCVHTGDIGRALTILGDLHSDSCDMDLLCAEFMNHLRSLMIIKTLRPASAVDALLICTDDDFARLKIQADNCSLEDILYRLHCLRNRGASLAGCGTTRGNGSRVRKTL